MTWFTSHFALEGLVVWSLLSEEKKEYFKEKKNIFALINLVAVLPDLDYFFGIHRSFTHSFVVLFTLLTIGIVSIQLLSKKKPQYSIFSYFIILGATFWFLHIILDLDYYGSLAIFWPLDQNVYDLSPYLIMSTLLYPLVLGFGLEVTQQDITSGLSHYFSNMTPGERYEVFHSNTFNMYLDELLFHLLIILVWILIVGIKTMNFNLNRIKILSNKKFSINKRFRSSYSMIGYLTIITGLILGPTIGLVVTDYDKNNRTLEVSNNIFIPASRTTLSIPKQLFEKPKLDLNITIDYIPDNEKLFLKGLYSTESTYNNMISNVTTLFNEYYPKNHSVPLENRTEELIQFRNEYSAVINEFVNKPETIVFNESKNLLRIEDYDLIFALVITDFNITDPSVIVLDGIRMSTSLIVTVKYERMANYLIGISLILFGIGLICIPEKWRL